MTLHAHDQTRSVPFPAPQQGPQRRPGLDGHSGTPETRKARKSDERDAT